MSQENVELVWRVFDAFNRRDLGTSLALTDEDVEGIPRAGARAKETPKTRNQAAERASD
jgi:ketosteroid isomerase-like protein